MKVSRQHYSKSLAWLCICGLLSIHHPVFAESAPSAESAGHDAHHAQKTQDWPGIYMGFLPCADCIGVKTTLALNKNNSYILITVNTGKSDREFVEKGKFTAGDKADTLVLTPKTGDKTRQYLVGKDTLTQLDEHGNRIAGKQAERFVLHRKDPSESEPASHSGH